MECQICGGLRHLDFRHVVVDNEKTMFYDLLCMKCWTWAYVGSFKYTKSWMHYGGWK